MDLGIFVKNAEHPLFVFSRNTQKAFTLLFVALIDLKNTNQKGISTRKTNFLGNLIFRQFEYIFYFAI